MAPSLYLWSVGGVLDRCVVCYGVGGAALDGGLDGQRRLWRQGRVLSMGVLVRVVGVARGVVAWLLVRVIPA